MTGAPARVASRRRPPVVVHGGEPDAGLGGGAMARLDGPPYAATVVIPCFNYGRFVRDAVRSALRQEDASISVVVVDDGSTDGKSPGQCDRCAGERVRVIHQDNVGLPAARNRGARGATTEFLVFLDADDWLEPTFVARLAEALRRDGDGASHAYAQPRMKDRAGSMVWSVPSWDPQLLMVTNLHPVTALVRRECFEAAGGFSEDMREGYEDWDLWLKFAGRAWRGVRVADPLFVYRRHSKSTLIWQAVAKHESLYRRIVSRHAEMFDANADALISRMNLMLRREDMNWLDESGVPINLLALERQRDRYESLAAVRAHRALHRAVQSLPRPVARGVRAALGAIKRVLPPPAGDPPRGR